MLYEVPDEILVWERSTMFISATRGQVDVSLWRTNLYTSTFCGVGPTGSQQLYFVYDSGLINDEFSNGLHASWAEQPHYNVTPKLMLQG